ncbi:MAG: hypothetical protein OQK05_03410 [Pseudopelagicola sp.]|nr:hypothetical protein [Pseudopelagicola sp.]
MTETDPRLTQKAQACTARVSKLEHQGQFYWVKREEKLSLRLRLQKGASASAFERERAALHQLAKLRAPVPAIVAEGPDFFVIPDQGASLDAILRGRNNETPDLKARAFADTAKALADLHAQHLSHGRPSLKDICWQDGRVTFIDFENYNPARNTLQGCARDVVMFFFNGLAFAGRPVRELEIARDTYRAHDPGNVWQAAQTFARRMRWTNWLTKPIQMRPEGKAKEFKAIPLTLAWFAE